MTNKNLKTFTTWWAEFRAFAPDIHLEASRSRIAKTFLALLTIYCFLLGILIAIAVTNQSCIEGRDTENTNKTGDDENTWCLFNDWQTRDSVCPDGGDILRYGYDKVNFLGMKTGKCFCCGGKEVPCKTPPNPWPLILSIFLGVAILIGVSIYCGMQVRKNTEIIDGGDFATTATSSIIENVMKRLSFEPNFPSGFDALRLKSTSVVSAHSVTNYKVILSRAKLFHNVARSSFSYDRLGGKLGEGQFGVVYRGSLLHHNTGELITVAIKTIQPDSNGETMESFLNEIKVMKFVGEHTNVISLLGVCVEDVKSGNVFGILELCEKGDLKSFLRMSRIVPAIKSTIEVSSILQGYLAIPDVPAENSYVKLWSDLDSSDGLFPQFVKWAKEIASGMAYLGSKNVLHVDLAARNVLLSNDLTAKVGDFGLSRKLYYLDDIYNKTGKEPIPIKWVAIESLTGNKYSFKSDVWSYGVTLWEIFSFGKEPFQSLSPQEFISVLISGIRLPCPDYCSEEIFDQMSSCWSEDPENRPSFIELEEYFNDLLQTLAADYDQAKGKPD